MKYISALTILFVSTIAFAQQNFVVTGKITDIKGEPVIGTAVVLDGSPSVGSISDNDGNYSISLPSSEAILIFTNIGYQELREKVSGRKVINVVLQEDSKLLDEVVIVGYGAMKKSDLTGSLSSIAITEEAASRSTTLDQLLEGRAAGMELISESSSPDAGFNIRIRGMGSFSTSTEPLYVVDGIIINGDSEAVDMTMSKDKNTSGTETSTNGLAGINPSDIAKIEILKDASATAIYGSQGANGVVLITTKNATKTKPTISFNAGVSVTQKSKTLDVLTLDEYVLYLEAKPNSVGSLETLNKIFKDYKSPEDRGTLAVSPISWQDFVCRTAVSQRYNFDISGIPNGYKYRFSISYKDVIGVMKNTDSKNLSMRLNAEKKFLKKLTVGIKANISYVNSNLTNGSSLGGRITSGASILRSILSTRPYINADPEIEDPELFEDEFQYGPNKWLQSFKNNSKRYRIMPSIFVNWQITPWLTFRSTAGGDFQTEQRFQSRSYKISDIGNTASIADIMRYKYNWDNLLLFSKNIQKHSISGTIGQSFSGEFSSKQLTQGWSLTQAFAGRNAVNSATADNSYQSLSESQSTLLSFFARGVYNYDNRYVLTATVRGDGSSKFQDKYKWSVFPSFAFAWRLSEEHWFKVPVISTAKLRLGWGAVGNQNIPNYQTQQTYTYNYYGTHFSPVSNYVVGFYPTNIQNPDLKWESSQQYDIGIDIGLWQGRLAMTIDGYLKDTKDLLQAKVIPASSGFTSMYVNSGSIRNAGVEFSIDAVAVKYGGFEWALNGNISMNRNMITDVGSEGSSGELYLSPDNKQKVNYFMGAALSTTATEPLNYFIEGQPMGLFYGYIVEGVLKEGETAPFLDETTRGEGYVKYKDINGDGKLTSADRTIIGNPNPKFNYGFGTSLSYKNITLSMTFVGSYGANVYNMNNVYDYYTNNSNNVRATAFYDSYDREKNPNGTMPKVGCVKEAEQKLNSTLFVEDGSYLNFKDISLSYDVPFKKNAKVLKGLCLTASAGNVALWTPYSGWTPKSASTKIKKMGVELNSYPESATFNFDVRFTF